jgi:hypothetical protein
MLEDVKKSIIDWYQNTGIGEKLIVLIKPNYLRHKESVGLVPLTKDMYYVAFGIKFVVCDEQDFDGEFVLVTEADFESTTKLRTMFHRLATNGEWLAAGKKGSKRKQALLSEAEGFAEMCSGYDHYAQLVNNYFGQYPESGMEVVLPKFIQSVNKRRGL